VSSIVVLQDIELIPVLKFEPFRFAAECRSSPSGFYEDMPEEWYRYWLASLAGSGIIGLTPAESGSWHVPTSEFTDPALLGRVLELIFQKLSEAEFSIDLECLPLDRDRGLALRCQSQNMLIEPVAQTSETLLAGEKRSVTGRPSGKTFRTAIRGCRYSIIRRD
jgi:hypothetical protein